MLASAQDYLRVIRLKQNLLSKTMVFLLLLFELSWHDGWLVGAGFIAALIMLGTIAGAIKNVKGEFIQPAIEWIWKPIKIRREQLVELIETTKKLSEQADRIEAEVKTNGGSSLKDFVIKINDKVTLVEKHADYANAKFRHHDQMSDKPNFEMDEHANLTLANPAMCNLLDVDEKDLLERKWLARVPFDERQRVSREWTEAAADCLPVDMIYPVIVGNQTVSVRVQATPRTNRDGKLCGFFGTMNLIEQNG